MEYKFTYRPYKNFLWKTHIIIGHRFEQLTDKMCLFFANGSVVEIPHWKDCELKLGTDWALAVKASLEQQSGQTIPLNIKGN
jgi:hypothetical protein